MKNFEFLAFNSKEIIEKQFDSCRQQHFYAGTVIGATALFNPFFLGGFDSTSLIIQFISIIPTAFFIYAILLMLSIFRTRLLDQAVNFQATIYSSNNIPIYIVIFLHITYITLV